MTRIERFGSIHEGHKGDSMRLLGGLLPRAHAVFLDVPYGHRGGGGLKPEHQGVKSGRGGNRDLAPFPVMHSSEFAKMALVIASGVAIDAPVVLMMSLGPSSTKARDGYLAAMAHAGFQVSCTGSYTKLTQGGKPCMFGRHALPKEGIWVFTKSGVGISADLDISAVRPPLSAYKTQKPFAVLSRVVTELSAEGDTWIDPFAGSGSMALACIALGRGSISIDIEHDPLIYAGLA